MTSQSWRRLVGVALHLGAFAVWTGCGGAVADVRSPKPSSNEPRVVDVATSVAIAREIPSIIRATGTFVADESSDVTPLAGGSVIETPVNVGDVVEARHVVARLDPRNATLDLTHAEAALQQAEAQAQNAKVEAERHATLVESGDISRSTYEKLTTQLATAEAAVAQANARVATAKKAVDDTVIVAPFAGHVSARPVSVGEYLTATSKVVTILRIQPIKLQLQLPESEAGRLRPGMAVRAEVPAHPGVGFRGAVSALNVALDPNSRSMTIEVRFPNTDARLMPGMFATAEINLPAKERAVYVPTTAIAAIANGQSSAVYVIEGTTAHVRVVQTGEAQPGVVRVLAGIEGGAVVATSRLDQLFEGVTVRLAAPAATRTSGSGK